MILVRRRQAPAPSTCAALSRSSGTSASPASSSSDMNGVVFQTSAITTTPSAGNWCGQRRAAVRQQVGQIPGAGRPGVVPAVGRGDRDDAVRDEHRGAHQPLADQGPVHHQRQRQAQHELDRHRSHRDRQRHRERRPPISVGEDRLVVAQADERGVVGGWRGYCVAGSATSRSRSDTPSPRASKIAAGATRTNASRWSERRFAVSAAVKAATPCRRWPSAPAR